jgi:hypothetical protein
LSEISRSTAVPQPSSTGALAVTRTSGWIVFAGVMIAVTGALNAIDGTIALYRTRYFADHFIIGNLREWALVFVALGALQIVAGLSILSRQGWARWFGLAMVSINAFLQLYAISSYPFYSVLIIAYDIAVFYALSVRWQKKAASS